VRYGIVSLESSESLWAAARFQDEGHDVLMYHAPPLRNPFETPTGRHVGEGIVPLATTWDQFIAWQPDIAFFDCTDYGKRADSLRRSGITVFGSCDFYDRLENDREFGMEIARKIGMEVPEYYTFSSISDSIKWLHDRPGDERWYFKTDRNLGSEFTAGGDKEHLSARLSWIRATKGDRIRHLLQREVKGADLMTNAYFNGTTFLLPFGGTLERKEFGNDDTGPKTGCSCNIIWMYGDVPPIAAAEGWGKLADILHEQQCPAAILDINAIVSFDDGKPYFLEWTPRLGIDSEPTAQRLLQIEYGEFIARLCEATLPMAPFAIEEAAFAIRLSVPPYPYTPHKVDEKHSPIGVPLLDLKGSLWGEKRSERFVAYDIRLGDEGYYECGDPHGLIGIASCVGDDLETMNNACVKYARSLGIPDLGYRTDGEIALKKDISKVRRAGHSAPLL
jgi:hypothetical protein